MKLKSCPFCQCEKVECEEVNYAFAVKCKNHDCLARGPLMYLEDDAIKKWNDRKDS